MTRKNIENYAAQVATRVGQQEAALHHHPLQGKIDRMLRKTMKYPKPAKQMPIDRCATGNCKRTALGSFLSEQHSPWFWLAVGAGVGGLAYMASRSGLVRNPDVGDIDTQSVWTIEQSAAIAVQAGIPTILWGVPGIGKTSWLEALGRAMDAKVFTVIGSTKDPADIGGMLRGDGTLIPPKWAREIRERSLNGLRSVLFLDEFSSMAPLVHAALLRVVREKIAGECDLDPKYKTRGRLKKGWIGTRGERTRYFGNAVHVVCAANPRSVNPASIDLPAPAANRMLHIQWPVPDPLAWATGLVQGFPLPKLSVLPENWRRMSEVRRAKQEIAAFLANHVKTLEFPDRKEDQGGAWPSPRSWEMAAEVLGAARIVNAPRVVEIVLLNGCVGQLGQNAFFRWLNASGTWVAEAEPRVIRALHDDPKEIDDVQDYVFLDHLYVLGQRLVEEVARHPSKKNWEDAWRLLEHIVAQSQVEGKTFEVAPLNVMASDLLSMLDDPKMFDELRGVRLPSDQLLEALDFEGIKIRPSRAVRSTRKS